MKYLNMISCNEFNHSIKHFVLYRDIDFIVDTKPIMMPVINPANIFANNDDKNGLELIHATDRLPVIIEIINIIINIHTCGKLIYIKIFFFSDLIFLSAR